MPGLFLIPLLSSSSSATTTSPTRRLPPETSSSPCCSLPTVQTQITWSQRAMISTLTSKKRPRSATTEQSLPLPDPALAGHLRHRERGTCISCGLPGEMIVKPMPRFLLEPDFWFHYISWAHTLVVLETREMSKKKKTQAPPWTCPTMR